MTDSSPHRPPPRWIGAAGLVLACIALLAVPIAMAGEAKRGLTVTVPLGLVALLLSASGASSRSGRVGMVVAVLALLGAAGYYLWLVSR